MKSWRKTLGAAIALTIFAIALYSLRKELAGYNFSQVRDALETVSRANLLQAIGFTICGYLALILYDALALRYVKRTLPARRVAFVGFVSYAMSNMLGFPLLLGGGLRYRFYNAWGLSTAEIALTIAFNSVTFWLGVVGLAGLALVLQPVAAHTALPLLTSGTLYAMGVAMLLVVAAYLFAAAFVRRSLHFRDWEFELPSAGLALSQVLVSSLDWLFAAAVLWALLPSNTPQLTFAAFLTAFLLGQVLGLVSNVPGGLGVFELVMLSLLQPPTISRTSLVGVLMLYRVIYYLMPLAIAAAMLATHELTRGKTRVARAARAASSWVPGVAPIILSISTFIGGMILLLSGATPALPGRLRLVSQLVPLTVIESSHFIGSLTGAALLVLARGLGRRLDAAYYLTVGALAIGIVASLGKGFDYEEAIALTLILIALLPARRHFYRRTSFTAEVFTPSWVLMAGVAVGASVWLGVFAYQHVDYSNDLWWRFALRGDAPRFLRATVGASALLGMFALFRLLRPAIPDPALPDAATLERVKPIVRASPDTGANLALVGDKSLLFSASADAFVMYGVEGRSFVAMGDPVGAPHERQELAWQFRELADRHGAWTVFYQVRMHNLPLYLDLGLSMLKLGEEAHVPLRDFSLDGGSRKGLRRMMKNVDKAGCTFDIVAEQDVPALLPRFRAISDEWLAAKRTREKGFSLGYWNDSYMTMAPVAVVRCGGEIVAFANLWEGAGREELSVDLMRYGAGAPDGVMEYLFVQLMLWGRDAGYGNFNLGMAPLAGLENRQLAPIWNRVGALLFRHAENFYNFQGLRTYKEKFDPVWEPRYLASPGGFALPVILTNVSTLVSRGLRGVVSR